MARFIESTKEINKAAQKQRKPKQRKPKPKQQKPKQNASVNKPASNKPAVTKTSGNKNKAGGSQYSVKQDRQITSRQTQAPKNSSVNRNTRANTNRATQRYSTNVRNGSQYSVANSANRRATRNYKQQQNNRFESRKNELKDSNILKSTKTATNNDIRRMGGAQYKVDNSSRETEFGKKIADAERRAKLGLKGGTIEVLGSLANYIAENTDDKFGNRERDRYALQYATGQISEKELNQKYKELDDRWNAEKKTLQKAAEDTTNLKQYGTSLKEEGREGLTGIKKTLYDGLTSIPYMTMTRAAGPLWPFITYMVGSGGTLADKKELLDSGQITEFERRLNSILSGGKEVVTEGMFGALTPLTRLPGAGAASKGLDDMILRGIDVATMKIKNGFLKNVAGSAMKLGAAGAEEAVEELVGSVLEVPAENISYRNRMDKEYRAGLGSNTGAIDEQVDYLISKGFTKSEAVGFILESVNSEETLGAIVSDYVNAGLSEKNAKRQAKNLQEYMSAHLSGDKEAKQAAEDKLAKGIKAEFSWKDANEAMAAAFAATAMTGAGTSAFSTFNGMNIKSQFEKVAGTKSAAETITEAAIKKGLDEEIASRALAMNEHAKKGNDLSYEQYAELGNAIFAQTYLNAKKADVAIRSAQKVANAESFYIMPGITQNKNGQYSFGRESITVGEDGKLARAVVKGGVTEAKAKATRATVSEIVNRIESESGKTLEDKDSFVEEMVALSCGYATPYTVDYLTEASPEYRSAYEEYFGQALPKDNEQMREFVYKQSAANLVESAKAETIDKIDTDKGFYDVQIANHLGEEGQQALQAISDNIGVLDSQTYIQHNNMLIGAYEEGRNGASLDKVLELYSDVRGLDRASVEAMYQAGVADQARGSDVGSVVYDVSDRNKIRNSHRDALLAFARIFGVKIVVTDKLTVEKANKIKDKQSIEEFDNAGAQVNGMFYDNTIYINLNDDIRKPIGYTIMHELTHGIKQMFPEDYDTFAELFKERWIAKNGEESFSKAIQGKIKTYTDNNVSLSEADALEEIICDQMAEVLYDEQFMQNIAENHPSLAQSLLYAIQDVIRKIRQLFANYGGFRSEFNEATLSQLDMLKDAEALLMKAIQAAQDGRTQEILGDAKKFSVDSEGNELSPQQSEYFKDSKVRDEEGNLRVMYHGSRNSFNTFDINAPVQNGRIHGDGFYFTPNKDSAEAWANGDMEDIGGESYDTNVYEAYLNIANPYYIDNSNENWKEEEIRDELIKRGYDGIISEAYEEVVAFYPEQIKSVDNKQPTLNPDIRFSIPSETIEALDSDGVGITDGGTAVRYSLSSWLDSDRAQLLNNLVSAGYDRADAKKWINDVSSVASIIAADKVRLDYEADQDQKALKPNGEYYYTLDLSTLCQKRRLYQGTYNAIMHRLVNYALTPEDTIEIRAMMDELGFEVPCGICYEESRKKNEGIFAQRWLNGYGKKWAGYKNMEHDDPYIPTLDEVTTTDGRAKLKKEHPEALESYLAYQRTRGSANPKVSFTHTDYRGDILELTENDIKKVKHIGGLRIQSFSDLEMVHIIDMMQAVVDMASRNLTAQAYTKVPAFADIFGGTGIKINLSLIGRYNEETGQLEFDAKEGIDPDEAFRIREKYSKNVGTILVGADDTSILKAWADDRIDMVIPFHRSGWKAKEFKKLGLNNYRDYTRWQSERYMNGKPNGQALSRASKDKGIPMNPIYSEDYWDYTKTGKENAEAYLKLCAEKKYIPVFSNFLVNNGDGSYSLQPDGSTDGYWKSLVDFKMYDNDGVGSPQQKVKPEFDMEAAQKHLDSYEGNADTLPIAEEVVDKFLEMYKEKHPGAKFSISVEEANRFEEEYRSLELWKLDEEESFDAQMEFYSKWQKGVADKDTLFYNTMCDWKSRKSRPKGKPDYVSRTRDGRVSSEYWYTDDGVIRGSNHWGKGVASCDWIVDGNRAQKYGLSKGEKIYAKASWGDFVFKTRSVVINGDNYLVNFDNTAGKGNVRTDDDYEYTYNPYDRKWYNAYKPAPLSEVIPSKESVIQYSINNPWDTSWFDGMLDDEEVNTRGDKNKSIAEISAEFTNIIRDNEKLTGGKILDRKSIKKQIGELVKMTTKDTTYTAKEKREITNFLMDTAEQIWSITGEKRPMKLKQEEIDRIISLLYDASDYVISNAKYINDTMLNEIIEFKKFFRGREVGVSAGARDELADDWDTIRKRNFGRVRFVSAEKHGVTNIADALIQTFPEAPEISLLYGREVEEALEIGDEATLVRILDDVLSNLSVVDDAIKSEYAEDFRVALSQDFARIVLNEGEAWESKMDRFKDRYEQRIKDLRARQKEAVRDMRSKYEKLLAEQNATFKKKLAETKAKSEAKLQAEKDKQKAKEQKRKDSEQRKKIRNRIAEDYNWLAQRLVKPKKDDFKHIPSDFVESVANLLEIFDFQTERSLQIEEKRGYASEPTKAMRELKDKISKYSSPDGSNTFIKNDALDALIDECINFLDDRPLRELEDYELQKVSDILRAVRHMVQTQNALFVENRKVGVAEAGESIISESAKKIEKYGRRYDRTGISGKLSHLLNETMMTPGNFFDSLGGTMKALYKNLRNAQDDYIMKVKFLRDFYKDILGGYYKKAKPGSAVEDWQTQTNEFTLSDGSKLNITVAQAMSLYCLSKREQALGHILGSGIVLSDVTLDKGIAKVIGGKVQNTASGYRMTHNDVMNVISSLTEEQRRIADAIQNLMNTTLKDWGNETSLRLFDMEFFTEENYFPISVEQSELATEIGKGTEIKGNRITSFGMTKPLTEHANNKIIIGDIFSIAADHCNKMALYSAYAPSLIDFNRVYNYKQRNEDGTTGYTVKGILKDAYSNKALKFIDNILDDINGQAQPRTDGLTAMINTSLANYKKAAIGLNPRVFVQQPTAIMRSLYMINPKYFTPDCFVGLKAAREEMHEHCPISAWKAWGNYQNDYTKNFEDVMLNKDWSKFDAVTMGAYGWADDMTWAVIWNAVKKEVKQKNPDVEVGSEEYWNLCNERASEIYDETQVVDSVFHRSDAMRSPNGFAKLFTSFMAEPTRTYNMVRSSAVKAFRSHKDGDNKAAASELNKMLVVVTLNAAAVSAAAAVIDAFRGKGDDDDDETWLETFYRNFGENFKDNVNMLHNIVFVKDVVSLFENAMDGKYFSPSNMVLEGWYKLAKGTAEYKKVLSGDKTFVQWISGDFGAGIGYVTGIPTATFIKDAKALWNRLSLPTFASDGVEEETPSLWDYENNPLEITDGTWADNVLNFFGLNLTAEERAERDFKRILKEVENKTKKLSGDEKKEEVNRIVMEGYTSLVEDGDFAKLKQMRRIIKAAGGDVEAFDEKVTKRTASEYKKTIGVEGSEQKQSEMRQYLLENGWTEAKISGEIVYKSNTAKEFKKACRELDIEKGTDILTTLILAGITEAVASKLWENRNRGNFDTYSTGKYIAPTNGQITSGFGYRSSPTAGASSYHQGIDIAASRGSVVSAADGGRVVYAGYNGGYGNQIIIQHDDGTQTYYSHLDYISVRKVQSVSQKQYIGNVGSTGISTGPHLDFRVNVGGQFVDPLKYFSV